MRNRKLVTLALSATVLGGVVLSAPAAVAADSGTTPVTFTLTSTGTLSVAVPSAEATLAPAGNLSLTGGSVSGALGETTVTDARSALLHGLTVNMAASDFVQKDTSGSTVATIAASNATAYSGLATGSLNTLAVPTTVATPAQIGNPGGATILTVNSFIGSGTVAFNPTVTVAVPATAAAGKYTGTITQTVE